MNTRIDNQFVTVFHGREFAMISCVECLAGWRLCERIAGEWLDARQTIKDDALYVKANRSARRLMP
jgi:hypothetical protein